MRLGEICEKTEPEQGKRTDLTSSHDDTKLEQVGPRMQRHRWQAIARWVTNNRALSPPPPAGRRRRLADASTYFYYICVMSA